MNYYPWSTQTLVNWIHSEACPSRDLQAASNQMQLPYQRVQAWRTEPLPKITLQDIRAITQYRGWNLNQTLQWLEITPAHFKELVEQG